MLGILRAHTPTDHPSLPGIAAARDRAAAPVWVSSELAFDRLGNPRPDYFTKTQQQIISGNQSSNSSGTCTAFLASPSELFQSMSSMEALVRNSQTIVTGDVIALHAGFFNGFPGTLYAIQVRDRLKSFGHSTSSPRMFLFYPETTIQTPRGNICARVFGDVPAPSVGDRVLVFDYTLALDREQLILDPDGRRQLVIERKGQLHTPAALKATVKSHIDAIAEQLRENPQINNIPEVNAQ